MIYPIYLIFMTYFKAMQRGVDEGKGAFTRFTRISVNSGIGDLKRDQYWSIIAHTFYVFKEANGK